MPKRMFCLLTTLLVVMIGALVLRVSSAVKKTTDVNPSSLTVEKVVETFEPKKKKTVATNGPVTITAHFNASINTGSKKPSLQNETNETQP